MLSYERYRREALRRNRAANIHVEPIHLSVQGHRRRGKHPPRSESSTPGETVAERSKPTNGERSAVGPDQAAVQMGNSGTLAHLLAEEFRQDKSSAAIRRHLRPKFSNKSASAGTALKRLQHRISDIEAYVEALEIVLDDDGTGQRKV